MRWNCPHCGSNLAVSDEKIGTGWSFSRCYKCGGFALVRKSDVNLVKVDRAPAGEPVLLPEASENPTALLSKNAAQNLSRYTGATAASANVPHLQISRAENRKPVIRTAVRRGTNPNTQIQNPAQIQTPLPTAQSLSLPEPLPEEPIRSFSQRLVPFAIAATGSMAIASGIYLYVQGQALWEKARAQATQQAAPPSEAEPVAAKIDTGSEIVQAPSISPDTPANTVAVAAIAPPPARADMIDEVHANAMAPNREETTAPTAATPAKAPATQIQVELLTDTAHIHSGPGMKFPVIGTANNKRKYAVEEWRDRWFKIRLESPAPAKTAWIRNDLVRLSP